MRTAHIPIGELAPCHVTTPKIFQIADTTP
jgi:hypothetical protein